MVALCSCESASVQGDQVLVMPDICVKVVSVGGEVAGFRRVGHLTVSNGPIAIGGDGEFLSIARSLARLMEVGDDAVGSGVFPGDFADLSRDADKKCWLAYVYPRWRDIPVMFAAGNLLYENGEVRVELVLLECVDLPGSAGPILDQQELATCWRTLCTHQLHGHIGLEEMPTNPVLVYARPESAEDRSRLGWPDESRGYVLRPTWVVGESQDIMIDARRRILWQRS